MTRDDARRLVESKLAESGRWIDGGLAILEDATIAKSYGWIFFYDSIAHIREPIFENVIAGNGPIVVLAATGEVVSLGSARRPSEEIARFERSRGLVSSTG